MQTIAQPDVQELDRERAELSRDDLCSVVIHNDDVTPYEYVIRLLGHVFMLSEELADHVAWTAHTQGRAVVIVRPQPEARKLVSAAHTSARLDGYPLAFSLEPVA
jgi:ATP-dependent Clp protease adaptor protein ClpS